MAEINEPTGRIMPGPLRYGTVGGFSLSGMYYDAEILPYNKAGHKAISQLRPATGYISHSLEPKVKT